MKTMVKSERMPIEAKFTWKRVRNSTKVAEWYWNMAFVMLTVAASAGHILLLMASVALLTSATLHRLKVEKKNKK